MEFCLPELGEGIVAAELIEWLVQPGQTVKRGQKLAEVMTDKATLDLPSPFSGNIVSLLVEPGSQVKVGQSMLHYQTSEVSERVSTEVLGQSSAAAEAAFPNGERSSRSVAQGAAKARVKAAPAVRQMARRLNVDLSQISGSGPGKRVLLDDLAAAVKRAPHLGAGDGVPRKPEHLRGAAGKPGTRIKLRGLRRRIAERMLHARQTIPHYAYVDECEVSDLVRLRESLKEPFAAAGVKLSYLPFFIKALVAALRDVPLANASWDDETGEIVLHDHYHIGIATDTPRGLLVPVLRHADRQGLAEMARQIERLTSAARAGTAAPNELRGSTFTVSLIGSIGGLISTPILNEPEVGILAIGRIVQRPRFDEAKRMYPADVVYLSFSFDHRVVDGADAARLSNGLIDRLKNPSALLFSDTLGGH